MAVSTESPAASQSSTDPRVDPEFEALIPPLQNDELEGLERSILSEGCRDALVVWREERILLDGHNRLAICQQHSVEFDVVELSFGDRTAAKLWMLRNQLGRRNIDTLTRIRLASALEEAVAARAAERRLEGNALGGKSSLNSSKTSDVAPEPAVEPVHTRKESAAAAGVSEFTYDAGKAVLAKGTPKLQAAVRSGAASISAAAKVAELPAEKQDEVVDKGEKAIVAAAKAAHHRTTGSGDNEWYTPHEYVEAARAVMGGFDLDPATSATAQARVGAKRFFTVEDDGLKQQWQGRVWMNPPYAQPAIDHFIRKLVEEFEGGGVTEAIALTHNYTDTTWFHAAVAAASAICFTRGRIKFESPDGRKAAPTQGQAFFYFGDSVEKFAEQFTPFGFIARVEARHGG